MHTRAAGLLIGCSIVLMAFAANGCSKGGPSAPRIFSLFGYVHVRVTERDVNGSSPGVLLVRDADNIPVQLLREGVPIGTSHTSAGRYEFSNVADAYRIRSIVIPSIGDSLDITLAGNLAIPDTLVLASNGGVSVYPNPFASSASVTYTLSSSTHVTLLVQTTDGAVVRHLVDQNQASGAHLVLWDGMDDLSQPLPAGVYWVILTTTGDRFGDAVIHSP